MAKFELKKPTTQLQEMLFTLLSEKTSTRRSVLLGCGILNPTARISDLRNDYFLNIRCEKIKVENKYGRKITYGSWKLVDKNKGLEVYKKLTKY